MFLQDIGIFFHELQKLLKFTFYFLFKRSLRAFPGLNFGVFEAAILIVSPVAGLRPSLAALFDTLKEPNPLLEGSRR